MTASIKSIIRSLLWTRPAHVRFGVVAGVNFVISYGIYLLSLIVMPPMAAYLVAYVVGLLTGNIMHIRLTHQKRLTASNFRIQSGIQVSIGVMTTLANGWGSQSMDPRLSGLTVIVAGALISFLLSRLLLR